MFRRVQKVVLDLLFVGAFREGLNIVTLAKCPEWSVPLNALHINKYGDGTDGRRIVLLATHPANPYVGEVAPDPDAFEYSLQWLAFCYLKILKTEFTSRNVDFLPCTWMDALDPSTGTGPYPIAWWSLAKGVPLASQDLQRADDQTIVLVAGTVDNHLPYHSGFGVRVVMHRLKKGEQSFAITSMTAHLPSLEYSDVISGLAVGHQPTDVELAQIREFLNHKPSFDIDPFLGSIALIAGQDQDSMTFAEVRYLRRDPEKDEPGIGMEFVTYGQKTRPLTETDEDKQKKPPTTGFSAVVTRLIFDSDSPVPRSGQRIAEWQLYSDATVTVPVFQQEPTSKQDLEEVPTYEYILRPSHEFDATVRETVDIPVKQTSQLFEVRKCPDLVKDDIDHGPYRFVLPQDGKVHPRSDLQSAISAYYCFDVFYKQVEAFGIFGKSLMRRANLPVQVHYRSGIAPGRGKDGNTVNARVALVNEKDSNPSFGNPTVHVHLALANLNRWHREVPEGGAFAHRPAQPLGFANSKRWVLHEIAHVLIAGVLGELEFRFAHSIGDAMAAVLCDPESRIAQADSNGPWAGFRYQTFPWIFTTRRHDRTVLTGWSWSGTMHRDVQNTPELQLRGLKGYRTEQILSTTIFRLYRALGGDTVADDGKPDVARRCAASRVVLYLILRAIESFVHWPLRAEELESALIDADVCLTSPLTSDVGDIWSGGQAHKVIRWAFEAQGMHPADPVNINYGIGGTPPVDLYIKDNRDGLEPTVAGIIDHGPGSYVPVSLHWDADADWTSGRLSVTDGAIIWGNRGHEDPISVSWRPWIGVLSGNEITWIPQPLVSQSISQRIDVERISLADFHVEIPETEAVELLYLCEISCESDRANTDPNAMLHCAIPDSGLPPKIPHEIADLVATDNNLALFWLVP